MADPASRDNGDRIRGGVDLIRVRARNAELRAKGIPGDQELSAACGDLAGGGHRSGLGCTPIPTPAKLALSVQWSRFDLRQAELDLARSTHPRLRARGRTRGMVYCR